MPDLTQDAVRAIVKNTFSIRRAEVGLSTKAQHLVNQAYQDAVAKIANTDLGKVSLKKLQAELDSIITNHFSTISRMATVDLVEIGVAQGQAAGGILQASLRGVPVDISRGAATKTLVASVIKNEPMQGALLKDWFSSLGDQTAFKVNRQIQIGVLQNESIDQIRNRLLGGGGSPGLLNVSKREADAVIRTAVNDITTKAHLATYKANKDVTTTFTYIATLDERTTDICISLDGQQFAYDDVKAKLPPQHFNCRSTIAPVIDWKKLGVDDTLLPEGTRPTRFLPGKTAVVDGVVSGTPGQVPAHLTYGDWLLQQPKALQNQILGPTRAGLFREGKISLKQLIDTENRSLTIEQLQKLVAQEVQDIAKAAAAQGVKPAANKGKKLGKTKLTQEERLDVARKVWDQTKAKGIIPTVDDIREVHGVSKLRAAEIRLRVLAAYDEAADAAQIDDILAKQFAKPDLPKADKDKIIGKLTQEQVDDLAKQLLAVDPGLVNTAYEVSLGTQMNLSQATTVRKAAKKLQQELADAAKAAHPDRFTKAEIQKLAKTINQTLEGSPQALSQLPDEFFTSAYQVPKSQVKYLKQAILDLDVDIDDLAKQWASGDGSTSAILQKVNAAGKYDEFMAALKVQQAGITDTVQAGAAKKLLTPDEIAHRVFNAGAKTPAAAVDSKLMKALAADSNVVVADVYKAVSKLIDEFGDALEKQILAGKVHLDDIPGWISDSSNAKLWGKLVKAQDTVDDAAAASKIPGAAKAASQFDEVVPVGLGDDLAETLDVFLDEKQVLGKKVAGPTGTNTKGVSGVWEGTDGKRYYVKQYDNPAQAYSEAISNRIYADLGLDVPNSHLVRQADGTILHATEYLDNVVGTLGEAGLTKARADQLLDGFVADVLTVNRDAVGTGLDNIVIKGSSAKNAKLYRIDQGGTFHFRAQGAAKEAFEGGIDEWTTLRTKNSYYSKLFEKAGLNSADDLGTKAIGQIDDVLGLQAKHKGWEKYVDQFTGLAPKDRSIIIKTLNERTELLKGKRQFLVDKYGQPVPKLLPDDVPKVATAQAKKADAAKAKLAQQSNAPTPSGIGLDFDTIAQEIAEAEVKSGKKMTLKQVSKKYGLDDKQAHSVKISAGFKKKKLTSGELPKAKKLTGINNPVLDPKTAKPEAKVVLDKWTQGENVTAPFQGVGGGLQTEFTGHISTVNGNLQGGNSLAKFSHAQKLGAAQVEEVDLSNLFTVRPTQQASSVTKHINSMAVDAKGALSGPEAIILRMADGSLVPLNRFSDEVLTAYRAFGQQKVRAKVIDAKALAAKGGPQYASLDPVAAAKAAKEAEKAAKKAAAKAKKEALEKKRKLQAVKKAGPPEDMKAQVTHLLENAPKTEWKGIFLDEDTLTWHFTDAPRGVKKNWEPRAFKGKVKTVQEKDLGFSEFVDQKAMGFSERTQLHRGSERFNAKPQKAYAKTAMKQMDEAQLDAMVQDWTSTIGGYPVGGTQDRVENIFNYWGNKWAGSSVDSDPGLIAMHLAAAEEFAMGAHAAKALTRAGAAYRKGKSFYERNKTVLRKMVRIQYDAMQAELKKEGIEWLTLWRWGGQTELAAATRAGNIGYWEGQPLSSFGAAQVYGGPHALAARVHRSEIFGHYRTGIGTAYEREYVVMGHKKPVVMWDHHVSSTEAIETFKRLGVWEGQ